MKYLHHQQTKSSLLRSKTGNAKILLLYNTIADSTLHKKRVHTKSDKPTLSRPVKEHKVKKSDKKKQHASKSPSPSPQELSEKDLQSESTVEEGYHFVLVLTLLIFQIYLLL